ncbi:MAG: hypothetical protein AB7K67_14010 [Hyphomicrobiaceae bacterium]
MKVIGILAASHIQPDHGARLRVAGAHHVVQSFADAEAVTQQLLAAT